MMAMATTTQSELTGRAPTGGTIIAPGAVVLESTLRRGLGMLGNLGLAMLVVLALPLAFAVIVALFEFAVAAVR
jgi:hypothetical protein